MRGSPKLTLSQPSFFSISYKIKLIRLNNKGKYFLFDLNSQNSHTKNAIKATLNKSCKKSTFILNKELIDQQAHKKE